MVDESSANVDRIGTLLLNIPGAAFSEPHRTVVLSERNPQRKKPQKDSNVMNAFIMGLVVSTVIGPVMGCAMLWFITDRRYQTAVRGGIAVVWAVYGVTLIILGSILATSTGAGCSTGPNKCAHSQNDSFPTARLLLVIGVGCIVMSLVFIYRVYKDVLRERKLLSQGVPSIHLTNATPGTSAYVLPKVPSNHMYLTTNEG
jgi:multisubunit Na+/H+ antiporter MnhC subunit